jgi:hypothetical protein
MSHATSSTVIASFASTFSHIIVAFVYCQIIASDALKEDNFVVRFLSMDVFTRYSKLTYSVYLIHPIVMVLTFGMLGSKVNMNLVEMVSWKFYGKSANEVDNLVFYVADNLWIFHPGIEHQDCALDDALYRNST